MAIRPALVTEQDLEQFRPQPPEPPTEAIAEREADDDEVDAGRDGAECAGDGLPSISQR